MSNEIAQVRQQANAMESQFKAALPAHIPAERFTRVVMTAIQNEPKLLNAPRGDLWNACVKAAQDGLLPDGREGALVLRYGRNLSVTWQPMIAGIRKKARNSGDISTWDAHVVHEGDAFTFQLGDAPRINHSYDLKTERGNPVGAYSVAVLKDGSKSFEVMSVSDINVIRDRSTAWVAYKAKKIKSTPWSTDWGEMARKTVAKRHSKVLPMSTDLDDLIRRDDDLYDFKGTSDAAVKADPATTLGGKMAALADNTDPGIEKIPDNIDPDTGEIIDQDDKSEGDPGPEKKENRGQDKAAEENQRRIQEEVEKRQREEAVEAAAAEKAKADAARQASAEPDNKPDKPTSETAEIKPEWSDPSTYDDDQIKAHDTGAANRTKGMARDIVTGGYASNPRLLTAYTTGWDAEGA